LPVLQLVIVAGILLSPVALAVGILLWAAAGFAIDRWRCRHPSQDLLERVQSFPKTSVADEAEHWLRSQ
jgi:hypothetical protein